MFHFYISEKKKNSTTVSAEKDTEVDKNSESSDIKGNKENGSNETATREDLLAKLKSLSMKKEGDVSDSDFDFSDDDVE